MYERFKLFRHKMVLEDKKESWIRINNLMLYAESIDEMIPVWQTIRPRREDSSTLYATTI